MTHLAPSVAFVIALLVPASLAQTHVPEPDVALEWTASVSTSTFPGTNVGAPVAAGGRVAALFFGSTSLFGQASVRVFDEVTGALLWEDSTGAGNPDLYPVALAFSPSGTQLVVTYAQTAGVDRTLFRILDASTGALVASASHMAPSGFASSVVDVAWSLDGQAILATGRAETGGAWPDVLVLAIEPASAALRWAVQVDGPDGTQDIGKWVAASATTAVVAADTAGVGFVIEATLLSFDLATGARTGEYRHGTSSAVALELEPGGSLALLLVDPPLAGDEVVAVAPGSSSALWSAPFAGNRAKGLAVSPGGTQLVVVGEALPKDGWVQAHDVTTGALVWSTGFSAASSPAHNDRPEAAVYRKDGSAVVLGVRSVPPSSPAGLSQDLVVAALASSDGSLLWEQRDDPGPGGDEWPIGLVATAGGKLFVSERAGSALKIPFARLLAIDGGSGAVLWAEDALGSPQPVDDFFELLARAPGVPRGFSLSREVPVTAGGTGRFVRGWDLASGASLWKREDNAPLAGTFVDLVGLPGGASLFALRANFELVRLDGTTGQQLWSVNQVVGKALAAELSVDSTRLFVAGGDAIAEPFLAYAGALAVAAHSVIDGSLLWLQAWGGPGAAGTLARALAVAPDGLRLFAVGGDTKILTPNGPPLVVAFDAATGAELWSTSVVVPGMIGGRMLDIVVTQDSSTVVIGGTFAPLAGPFVRGAAGLDAVTGALLWTDVGSLPASGTSPGSRFDLAAAPSGPLVVFAAGEDSTPGTPSDDMLLVIGYDAATGGHLFEAHPEAALMPQAPRVAFLDDGLTVVVAASLGGASASSFLSVGLDTSAGVELWRSTHTGASLPSALSPATFLVADGDGVVLAGALMAAGGKQDAALVRLTPKSLVAGPPEISAASGGTHRFFLHEPAAAGDLYLVLGSSSGTSPGLPIAGAGTLPLNPDAYLTLTLAQANTALLPGTLGVLDATGRASAGLVLPPLAPSFVGLVLQHAFVTFDVSGQVQTISHASPLALVP